MYKKSTLVGGLAVIIAIALFGFNQNEPKVPKCSKVNTENWGIKAPFVTEMVSKMKAVEEKENQRLKVTIFGYNEELIKQDSIVFEDMDERNFPDGWIEAINHKQNYAWHRVYRRSIKRNQLLKATEVYELIQDYPKEWLREYSTTNVGIKSIVDKEHLSFSGEGQMLTNEQKALLRRCDINQQLDVVINYKRINYITEEEEFIRLNIRLRVVPEQEAKFPSGYGQLIGYFNKNVKELDEQNMLEDFSFVHMKFVIDEKGFAKVVHYMRESENPDIDRRISEFIEKMPRWQAANNAQGQSVKQEFELLFGAPGC